MVEPSGLSSGNFSGPALVIEDDALIALAVADMLDHLASVRSKPRIR